MLSLQGKLLNYSNINLIKIRGEKIKISSELGITEHTFGTCEIFDPTRLDLENRIVHPHPEIYIVYDDFELANLGGKHIELESKKSQSKFAKEIHYYNSSRVDGAQYITDCVVESRLNKDQLGDVQFSDSMIRFAVERHLYSIGITGNFMKLYKNGKPKYRKPRVTHKRRIVAKREMNRYEDSYNVKFLDLSLEDVLGVSFN